MKKIIFSITAIMWSVIQSNAQVGALSPTPPTLSTPAVPPVEAYSNSTSSITRAAVTTRHKTTVYTESYTTSSPQEGQYDDAQRSKIVSKAYGIGKGDKVNVSNIYGNIIFKTWDKNEVKFDADIRAFANSEEEAQKLIDNILITSSKNGDEAVFKVQLENRNGSWGNGSKNGKRWRREVKIFMTVFLPANVALIASQQYGNIEIPDFYGPTALKVQYGKLVTGNLSNANNFISAQYTVVDLKDVNKATIKQQYGNGLTIASIGDLTLNAQYAAVKIGTIKGNADIKQQYGNGLSIGSVDNLELEAQYASVKLGTVRGDANIKIQYGNGLFAEQVGNLSLTAQYVGVRIGRLTGTLTAKSQYGNGLTVEKVEPTSKMVNIDSEYVTTTLAFAPNYGGNLNVNTYYSNFKAGENISARRVGSDNDKGYSSSKEYDGTIGKGGSSIVRVNAKYGGVIFR